MELVSIKSIPVWFQKDRRFLSNLEDPRRPADCLGYQLQQMFQAAFRFFQGGLMVFGRCFDGFWRFFLMLWMMGSTVSFSVDIHGEFPMNSWRVPHDFEETKGVRPSLAGCGAESEQQRGWGASEKIMVEAPLVNQRTDRGDPVYDSSVGANNSKS